MAATIKAEPAAQVRRLRKSLEREKAKSAGLAKSLAESREQQAASAEILKVISRSPADAQPVFDAIVRRALRLIGGRSAAVTRIADGMLHLAALTSTSKSGDAALRKGYPGPLAQRPFTARAIRSRAPYSIRDTEKAARRGFARLREVGRARGFRSALVVPMLRDGVAIGTLSVTRKEPGVFSGHQLDMLKTFAEQAVIAIEKVRLFNETKEALEQQTATAEILKVISSSPTDVQPVFDAIVRNAVGLCGATFGIVFRYDGELLHFSCGYNLAPGVLDEFRAGFPMRPTHSLVSGRAILSKSLAFVEDAFSDPDHDNRFAVAGGWRRLLGVPMLREGDPIGVIFVAWAEPGPIPQVQQELVKTFADQAVIAIENVRLFNETKEALEHQKASADILRVISSSPTDLAPVMAALAESAARLCEATDAHVWQREGEDLQAVASHGRLPLSRPRLRIGRDSVTGRAALDCKLVHVHDLAVVCDDEFPDSKAMIEGGYRSVLAVPLVREGASIGAILIRRTEVQPFTAKQLALLQTFADHAVIAIENVRLFNETKEALERQTATAEILKVIASSPSDVQPVLDTVAERAALLCNVPNVTVWLADGEVLHPAATYWQEGRADGRRGDSVPISMTSLNGRAVLERRTIHVEDIVPLLDSEYPDARERVGQFGHRALAAVPMIREGNAIGSITIWRREAGLFSDAQIALLQTFADQAVIAIENVRLFNETKEALERQTATAEILRVIASSPTDVQPVFDTIARSAVILCGGMYANVFRFDGELLHWVASHGLDGSGRGALARKYPMHPDLSQLSGRAMLAKSLVYTEDTRSDPDYDPALAAKWARRMLGAPMLRDGNPVGAIVVGWAEPGTTPIVQQELLKTFADQAVIAIENVRLFNETKEALERQTATAEILQVIGSSPTDTQPVFDAIVNSGVRLFPGAMITVARPDGGTVRAAAIAHEDTTRVARWRERFTTPLSRDRLHAAAILDAKLIDFPDAEAEKDGPLGPGVRNFLLSGNRAVTIMPMLRGEGAIGAISVTRAVPGPLSDKQIAILRTFAGQAVIAIENVRLFNETKEALERQTATAEILKVIAGSPTDVQPVFDVIVESAVRLCGARFGRVYRYDGSVIQMVAGHGLSTNGLAQVQRVFPRPAADDTIVGRVILTRRPFYVRDIEREETVPALSRQMIEALGTRSQVTIPMLRAAEPIGAITMGWDESEAFDDQQVALLQTFADQAVIAIENVRLFNETKESLERQTATAEILKVIASSPSDVQPVFDTIVKSALALCKGMYANVFRYDGEMLHFMATESLSPRGLELLKAKYPMKPDASQVSGRVILAKAVVRIEDAFLDRDYDPRMVGVVGWRRMLGVPMLREGAPVGVIVVAWGESGSILKHHEELLQTFADQAVIAIENVRLFNETKEALEQQTASSEILGVISSSPTDLAPVFDAILDGATRLCDAHLGVLNLYDGEHYRTVAQRGGNPAFAKWVFERGAFKPFSTMAQMIAERRPFQIADLKESPGFREGIVHPVNFVELGGARSFLAVPLVKDDRVMGGISIYRPEVRPFTEKQIALVSTFADQAVIAIENVRLFNETKEALERQTATAAILKVISSSPTDTQPVFDAIVRNAVNLCESAYANVFRYDGELLHYVTSFGWPSHLLPGMQSSFPMRPNPSRVAGRVILGKQAVRVEDAQSDPEYDQDLAHTMGARKILGVPMFREGNAFGVITVGWEEPGPVQQRHEDLLKTFADQAVIAIENVRLFKELEARNRDLTEALEQQTATSEILRAISQSPTDVQPVFDIIAERAVSLCNGEVSVVSRFDGTVLQLAAIHGVTPEGVGALRPVFPMRLDAETMTARAFRQRAVIHMKDVQADPLYEQKDTALAAGWRGGLAVPMLRGTEVIGVIFVGRSTARLFTDSQVELLKTFADQAVIAIENVRLFNETKEALERQTATGEILASMSGSMTDTKPVFDAIVRNLLRLFGTLYATVFLIRDGQIELAGFKGEASFAKLPERFPVPLDERTIVGKAIVTGQVMQLAPIIGNPTAPTERFANEFGFNSIIVAPMVREGKIIGAVATAHRDAVPFNDKQVALIRSFADQAVIAIENVRLFNETKEALERQTATAEILKVISSSPRDLQPVFDAILEKAMRLCEAHLGFLGLYDGERYEHVAERGSSREFAKWIARGPFVPDPRMVLTRALRERKPIHEKDLRESAGYREGVEPMVKTVEVAGARTILAVPMLKEEHPVGGIIIYRPEVRPFTQKQIDLVSTFASQAVIAIENVRLFKELEARTEALTRSVGQLTVLGEVGQAVSSSLDLETVLQTIVARAVQLTGLDGATIYEFDEASGEFHLRAAHNMPDDLADVYRRMPIRLGEGIVGKAAETREPVQVPDIQDPSYQTRYRDRLIREGYRAILAVPMLRDEHIVGAFTVNRGKPGAFPAEVVELLKTFATQSALAIQNARLFREIAEKGRQLEIASRHKSDFLASMSHELRTPLNAILGFNEMLLGQVYGDVPDDMQAPLAQMQTSGKHLLRLINNVLDLAKIEAGRMELALSDYSVQDIVESVRSTLRPLAAEKGLEFLATVPADIPLAFGDPGRIAQCLMNLAGNSLKFTKAGKVEISVEQRDGLLRYCVADTGIGIAPDKLETVFAEFKQTDATIASEYGGTGLGLSISRKFVEMHGGRIWVESEIGKGSTFIFEIPLRAGAGARA